MYVNITPLIKYVHLGYELFHLGNVCQERVKQHEWHVSHHYTRLTEMLNGGRLPSKLHVFRHDGDALGVNGAQVGILEQSNKVSFRSLLEGKYSRALETQVVLDIFSTLSYQTLEWRLANQKVCRLLVLPYLSKLP